MAVNRVELKDFLVFKGEFAADFCPGVNVLIGGNGTGKTTLLKVMYGVINSKLPKCFYTRNMKDDVSFGKGNINIYDTGALIKFEQGEFNLDASASAHTLNGTIKRTGMEMPNYTIFGNPSNGSGQTIYIPEKDILSNSPGLLPWKYERPTIPFDDTLIDILAKAQLHPKNEISNEALCARIREIIGGEVAYDNDEFFIIKDKDHSQVAFSKEASGHKKFGLLWKLIRNGLLESGSILFWDEPENSLNPELVPVLVDILLELSRGGVQIFIATHDYNFARYFDVRKDKSVPVLYHNLSKTDDGRIICNSSPDYIKLSDNLLEKASADLFKAVVSDAMEVRDDG